jgi:hypothetical protein
MSSYRCGCYDLYLAYSPGGSSSGNYGANPVVSEDTNMGRLPHHPRFNVTGTKRVNLKTSSNIRLRAFSIAWAVLGAHDGRPLLSCSIESVKQAAGVA